MTEQNQIEQTTPAKGLGLKMSEMFIFAGVLGVFAGLIVLMSSRSFVLAGTFFAIAFFVSLLFIWLLGLGGKKKQ